ncbi:acetoacetate--CoA ligase (plasmid) [Streptomyces sp. NBC_00841]|uniref:acetoacetate--CoA ligase n=1 Tax=unclassified Streptomyces TaxID=2593676 RepID=UPI00225847C2|nr:MULTISPECIES: acetoacetate--CoA ligase [unclassified Streptomyces]MCX4538067.1 acetoacetate--CoA ligase [Streptomyces sp. NBC_01669]WSA05240.1 acetoacetate--CoA ligase [Streptomyces sp. NBC_00841]
MTTTVKPEAELLHEPHPDNVARARVQDYLRWLREEKGLELATWDELQQWSVTQLEDFWESIWQYFNVKAHAPYEAVLPVRTMPGAQWFPGATLNYAEHCFGVPEDADTVAVVAVSQTREPIEVTFAELADQVRRVRAGLVRLGVRRGDRVAAHLPNCPETLVAFLATASLGAIWSSCAPEFGARSVIDRFAQIEPRVLLAVAGYTYGEKQIDKRADVAEIRAALTTAEHVVHVPYGPLALDDTVSWTDLLAETDAPLTFEPVPFDHPLYILYSSGTTGQPKAIVHRHGGILLEHLKAHTFHWDLGPGDRLLWFTTTAWMMWNSMVSALLVRAGMVMIDGNPLHPDLRYQWRLAEETGATLMGASPGYLMSCRKEGIRPAEEFDLSRLRQLGVVGSPFPAEGFRWVDEQFGNRIVLNVGSGGTDVCTGTVQASPLTPVYVGEMSGPTLGVDIKAFDRDGNVVVGELGELVITSPMPSMPIGFWGDEGGSRLSAAYFEEYDGVFRFGDWCRFSSVGSCIITGRSDATLNRGGVRLGTAEFYRVLQDVPEVSDSVIVHLEDPHGGMGELILFVVPADGAPLDDALKARLVKAIRTALSPRHVPDTIVPVPAVPYSRTGKKLEVPVKKILRGTAPEEAASPGALVDPSALDAYAEYARTHAESER